MIRLRRWADADWPLLVRLNAPEMTDHLGGPETDEAVRRRHERYLAAADGVICLTAVLEPEGVAVGNVNIWERDWRG
ncbi:MAG TPA: GNAT family N-acetyltransferase, partial [Candidatus Dormibacteraeota bacterium]|nr:GNAT family N-acetyltransferase [Candidatus Dormibacteraeota bacterium]